MAEKKPTEPGLFEELPDKLHPLLDALVRNLKWVAVAVAAVLVVVGIFAVSRHLEARAAAETREELARLAQTSGPERAQALEKLLDDAPEAAEIAVRIELVRAYAELGRHKDAQKAWEEIGEDAGPSFEVVAGLGRAAALSRAGEHAEAAGLVEDLQGDAPESFRPVLSRQLAVDAMLAGDQETARAALEDLRGRGAGAAAYVDYLLRRLGPAS